MIADEREKAHASASQLKLALIAHDPAKYMPLFFGESKVSAPADSTRQIVEVEDFDPDDTAGEWKFEEKIDPQEAERMMREMLADPSGTLTSTSLGEWQ